MSPPNGSKSRNARYERRAKGWSYKKARRHRERARAYGDQDPSLITGPLVLAVVLATGAKCGICNKEVPWPWDTVGNSEAELDHILDITEIRAQGRNDWASPNNLQLLCHTCHVYEKEEGARALDESISQAVDHALAKELWQEIENEPFF